MALHLTWPDDYIRNSREHSPPQYRDIVQRVTVGSEQTVHTVKGGSDIGLLQSVKEIYRWMTRNVQTGQDA